MAARDAKPRRRTPEEARQIRERQRATAEASRQVGERRREAAETARAAGEVARIAAERARDAMVDSLRATAVSLKTTLEQMIVVEQLRRTLRDIRETNKLDSN